MDSVINFLIGIGAGLVLSGSFCYFLGCLLTEMERNRNAKIEKERAKNIARDFLKQGWTPERIKQLNEGRRYPLVDINEFNKQFKHHEN